MKLFVTGDAGCIGSHALVEFLSAGHDVCVYYNFCNSSPDALDQVRRLTGRDLQVVEGDLLDAARLTESLRNYAPDAVVHFAGLKAVGESSAEPLLNYRNKCLRIGEPA